VRNVHEVARVKGRYSAFIVLLDAWRRGQNNYWVRRIDRTDGSVLEHYHYRNLSNALVRCSHEAEKEWSR